MSSIISIINLVLEQDFEGGPARTRILPSVAQVVYYNCNERRYHHPQKEKKLIDVWKVLICKYRRGSTAWGMDDTELCSDCIDYRWGQGGAMKPVQALEFVQDRTNRKRHYLRVQTIPWLTCRRSR